MSRYHTIDIRTHEEKELEESCTFKPKIIRTSPFISERTLREISKQRIRKAPPPPPPPSDGSSGSTRSFSPLYKSRGVKANASQRSLPIQSVPICGTYSKSRGFVKGPPAAPDMPLFIFDPISPPNFAAGKYGNLVTVEETKPQALAVEPPRMEDRAPPTPAKAALAAPPLPPWLNGGSGGNTPKPEAAAGGPKKLVIQKVAKKEAPKEEAQGWQAVMAEMSLKRAQMKNKAATAAPAKKEVEKKAPMKKIESGKKKKPKDFKDIMDELAYKFASMRGEIEEEEEEKGSTPPAEGKSAAEDPSEETKQVPSKEGSRRPSQTQAPPEPPTAADAKVQASPAPTKKLMIKPDLASMLAKVKAPPPAAPPTAPPAAKPPLPPAAPNLAKLLAGPPVAAAASSSSQPMGKIAVAKPARIPGGPPLPAAWPPVPHKAPPGSQAPSSSSAPPSSASPEKPKENRTSESKAPADRPAPAKATTTTTVSKQEDLPEGYYMAASMEDKVAPNGILPKGTMPADLIARLVDLFKQANATHSEQQAQTQPSQASQTGEGSPTREVSMADQEVLKATRKLAVSDLPTPASFAAAVQRMKRSKEIREAAWEAEKQKELRNYPTAQPSTTRERTTSPVFSSSGGGGGGGGGSTSTPSKAVNFFTDRYFENKSLSFRKSTTVTDESRLPLCSVLEKKGRGGVYTYQDADLPTVRWLQSLRNAEPQEAKSAPHAVSSGASVATSISSVSDARHKYMQQLHMPTEGREPHFRTQTVLDRRQAVRSDKELHAQNCERQAQEMERRRKEAMRRKAMETAQQMGAFRSPNRLHSHQKIIEKYSGQRGLGVDLAMATRQAYNSYAAQHLFTPERAASLHSESMASMEAYFHSEGRRVGSQGHEELPFETPVRGEPSFYAEELASPYFNPQAGSMNLDDLLVDYDN